MKKLLFAFLEKHPSSKEFFIKLCSVGDVFLIGGVLREYKDHADFISLRDIDIAIQVDDDLAYNNLVKEFSLYINTLRQNDSIAR